MAGRDWIESVYTLATLPSPLDSAPGSISASIVSSLSKGKKRKRTEIATAISGEGINLYSIEDSNLITSYAVSPGTSFDAPPCSIFCKRTKQTPPRRLTYTVSRTSKSSTTARLSCFGAGPQDTGRNTSKSAGQNLPSPAPTTLIDVLPNTHETNDTTESHQVITLQKDGHISCFSEQAQKSLWSTEITSLTTAADGFVLPGNFELAHAELVPLSVASQGILKGRQDVLAILDAADAASTYILAVIAVSPSIHLVGCFDADVHLYALRANTSSRAPVSRVLPQQLVSWRLPQAAGWSRSTNSDFKLGCSTGSLTELNNGAIITYDLSRLLPKVVDTFTSRDQPQAVIKLTSSLLLSASSEKFAIHDSKYGSFLSSWQIEDDQPAISAKGEDGLQAVTGPSIQLVGYSKQMSVAVALRGNHIIVIKLNELARTSKRQKADTLLINSLGKGSLDSQLRLDGKEARGETKKRKRASVGGSSLFVSPELDALAEDGQGDEFDSQFATFAKFGLHKRKSNASNEQGAETQLYWNFPAMHKFSQLPLSRPQALYALSKMFEPCAIKSEGLDSKSASIRMIMYPENVFLWLVHTGQLSTDLIERAFHEYMGFDRHVARGDLVKALSEYDNDLPLVNYLLLHHPNLNAEELVTAVKAIVKSLDNSTLPQPEHKLLMDNEFANAAASTGALTNGVGGLTNGDLSMTNGHVKDDKEVDDIDSVADAAMKDVDDMIDEAYETLDKLIPLREETLRHALIKLNMLPPTLVTSTLRAKLTQHELVFLIHILRVQLDQGGWTTRYGDRDHNEDAESTEDPFDRAITVICNVLSCAVDAVGMSGWLAASASNPFDSIDETLNQLRGEISNTLEGVHEATFIYGVLSDFLRHHYKRQSSELGQTQTRTTNTTLDPEAARRKEQALWKEGKTVIVEKAPPPYLPIGLGLEGQGIQTNVGLYEKTLHQENRKKRMADVGREIRRGLPQYVFERIRF